MKIDLGGMRLDEVLISLSTFTFRLRIAVCLLEEHNRTVLVSGATEYSHKLISDLLEASEDATAFLEAAALRESEEARLGEESIRRYGDRTGDPGDERPY